MTIDFAQCSEEIHFKEMKKSVLIIFIHLLSFPEILGQCSCANLYDDELTVPDTLISLNNDYSFAICGYEENGFYSEFTISDCRSKKALKFYSAVHNYKIDIDKDTLKLVDYRFIKFSNKLEASIPWAIDYYFGFDGIHKSERRIVYNPLSQNIDEVLFEQSWKNEEKDDWINNQDLILQSFLLALINSNKHEKKFKTFRDTFKIGGANAEYYNELLLMYKEFKELNNLR